MSPNQVYLRRIKQFPPSAGFTRSFIRIIVLKTSNLCLTGKMLQVVASDAADGKLGISNSRSSFARCIADDS